MTTDAKKSLSERVSLPLILQGILLMLGLWGCLAVYNATIYGDYPRSFAARQFIWLSCSFIVLTTVSRLNFGEIQSALLRVALISYCALVLVLVFGTRINGMKGWYSTGLFLVQPSELAKPFFILSLCYVDRKYKGHKCTALLFGLGLLWLLPIMLQPDFGTAAVYAAGFAIFYFLRGKQLWIMIPALAASVPLSGLLLLKIPYMLRRLQGFRDAEAMQLGAGWHIMQFKYTLARGGFSGASWGRAVWANNYLPLPYSDSAFASLTEAVGFLGAVPVIAGLLGVAYIGYRLAVAGNDGFRRLYICSFTGMLLFQALVHISVNVALAPPTGITLPMFSYGGSSLLSTMLGAGILLSAAESVPEKCE